MAIEICVNQEYCPLTSSDGPIQLFQFLFELFCHSKGIIQMLEAHRLFAFHGQGVTRPTGYSNRDGPDNPITSQNWDALYSASLHQSQCSFFLTCSTALVHLSRLPKMPRQPPSLLLLIKLPNPKFIPPRPLINTLRHLNPNLALRLPSLLNHPSSNLVTAERRQR
jgi:hypothetical protein